MTEDQAWATVEFALINKEWVRLLVVADRLQELNQEPAAVFLRWYATKGNRVWRMHPDTWPYKHQWKAQWVGIDDEVNCIQRETTLKRRVRELVEERKQMQETFND